MDRKKLSVVIPAYNEEFRIVSTIDSLERNMKNKNIEYELIVVDDGSSDNTAEVVRRLQTKIPSIILISSIKNMGKGYAVKVGVERSSGEVILFADADGSTPFDELDSMLKAIIEGYDIVIGSRAIKAENIDLKTSAHRKYIGRVFNLLVISILGLKFKDTQCGFKLFKRDVAKVVFSLQTLNRYGFDVEILYVAIKNKYKILEVPVNWRNKSGSKVNLIIDSIDMFASLFKIKLFCYMGRYKVVEG